MHIAKMMRTVLIATALTLAVPQPAFAGRGKVRKLSKRKRRRLAKKLFMKAKKDFELGRFQKALGGFTRAYELISHPGLLFNIGQCHRMLKHYKKAVFFYDGYLSAIPDAANRVEVQKLMADSRRKMKEAAAAARAAAERKRKAEEARRRLELQKARLRLKARGGTQTGPFVPRPEKEKPKPAPFYKKWWFWSAIGAGVAAAVAASLAVTLTRKTETVLPSGSVGTIDWR